MFVYAPLADLSLERYQLPKELALIAASALAIGGLARRVRWDVLDVAMGLAAIAAIASAACATNGWIGARLAALTVAGVALAIALREEDDDARDRARGWVIAAAGALAAITLAETYGAIAGMSSYGRAPGATLGQRNTVAHVLAIVVPFAWRASIVSSRARWRVAAMLVVALASAAIVVTRSRAGWLALGIGAIALAVWAVVDRGRRARHLGSALAMTSGIVAVATTRPALAWRSAHPYRDTLERLVDASGGSGHGRLVQIDASRALIHEHPWLGVGPGNWAVEYPAVSPSGDPTFFADAWEHTGRLLTSDVAALAIERGALGVVSGLACGIALIVVIARLEDRSLRAVCAACLGATVPLVLFDSVLQIAAPLAVLAVLLAPPVDREVRVWGAPRWIGIVLATGLMLAATHRAIEIQALALRAHGTPAALASAARLDPGDYTSRARLAETLLAEGDCPHALPLLDEMVALRPRHRRPRTEREVCEALTAPRTPRAR
ncbi:O-antigen polymerase [Sandaracinus amylolyticus]|uniref:O-antigen polymerase n=2 Tax=Sandaracinus amylolyticus TaxID=927083 RepID=A0A0F6SEB0_9BACT|nr:O-antigen polymerase [Sandaracinus amylolyticus]